MAGSLGAAIKSRLGCSTITFRDLSLSDALSRIEESGLKKVDIACIPGFCPHINPLEFSANEEKALKARLDSAGLIISTLNVSAGGLNTDQAEHAFSFYKAALDLAGRLGCYAITIPPGKVVGEDVWRANAEASSKRIKQLADHADSIGITLTREDKVT